MTLASRRHSWLYCLSLTLPHMDKLMEAMAAKSPETKKLQLALCDKDDNPIAVAAKQSRRYPWFAYSEIVDVSGPPWQFPYSETFSNYIGPTWCSSVRQKGHHVILMRWNASGILRGLQIGQSGGLAMLWWKEFHVQFINLSVNHIDTTITLQENSQVVRLPGFYGCPSVVHMVNLWRRL